MKREITADDVTQLRRPGLLQRMWEHRIAYLMLSPVIVGFFVFTLYPQVWVLSLSFFRYDGFREAQWLGLQNFVRLFQRDPLWWRSVWNTFYFSFGKLAMELPLALVLAVILNRQLAGRNFFRGLFFLPHVTSTAIMALVFYFIYAPYQGILNGLLQSLGLITEPIDWLGTGNAMFSTMVVSVWQNFGINMVLFLAGLQAIPDDLFESAEIDGANAAQRFWYITIPALGRMLQVIVMLAIIGSLRSFDLFRVLTRGGPGTETTVMMLYIFNYFFDRGALGAGATIPQYGYASALGVIASIIIAMITGVYLWWSRRLAQNQG